jgi:hypothetical protein
MIKTKSTQLTNDVLISKAKIWIDSLKNTKYQNMSKMTYTNEELIQIGRNLVNLRK